MRAVREGTPTIGVTCMLSAAERVQAHLGGACYSLLNQFESAVQEVASCPVPQLRPRCGGYFADNAGRQS